MARQQRRVVYDGIVRERENVCVVRFLGEFLPSNPTSWSDVDHRHITKSS